MSNLLAYFDEYNLINFAMSKKYYDGKSKVFYLEHNDTKRKLAYEVVKEDKEYIYYRASFSLKLKVGDVYRLFDAYGLSTVVEYRFITKTKEFNEAFATDAVLGSIYTPNATTFRVWAPTANEVLLKLSDSIYKMKRGTKGVYEVKVDGDLDGETYLYLVNVNGRVYETKDPYAKLTTYNAKQSVVYNPSKTNIDWVNYKVKENKSIYEFSIKDISFFHEENKGKYEGLNNKVYNYDTIYDYIQSLNVSHVQILPIHDIGSIYDDGSDYNWGYDPMQYMCLEGSYSSNPKDPYARVIEFKNLVNEFHKRNLGVNIDVVVNHIYNVDQSSFHRTVPYYYFSYENNKLTSYSGCGNDFDATQIMTNKYIETYILYLVNEYHIDGIRYDLMGLLDYVTLENIRKQLVEINPDVMYYGESWNMRSGSIYANFHNLKKTPKIGGFNDYFRDNIMGSPFEKENVGIIFYNLDKQYFIEDVMNGKHGGDLANHNQSINYVECHDGPALIDYVKGNKKRAMLATALICLSKGIPFIHSGQEILKTKYMLDNTYIAGGKINGIDFENGKDNLDVKEMVSTLLKLRDEIYDENTKVSFYFDGDGLVFDIYGKKTIILIICLKKELKVDLKNVYFKTYEGNTLTRDDFVVFERY